MKKGISIALALILSFAGVYSAKADDLTDAQKKLNNIQQSINDKKEELKDINEGKNTIEKTLGDLEEKMKSSSANLTQLNGTISDLDSKVGELEKQIVQNETSMKEQDELFKKRIRAMYISGNNGYLDFITLLFFNS